MKINAEKCVGCGQCIPYCPTEAISRNLKTFKSEINQEKCLECHTCFRSRICPVGALEIEELSYPRELRGVFSDVLKPHKSTGVLGRGTEEMKTNDVTSRLKPGMIGVSVELGRPGIGANFADLQIIAKELVKIGIHFEEANPVASLMSDTTTGTFKAEILNERFLSALLEFEIDESKLSEVVDALHRVERDVNTVFSVGVSKYIEKDRDSLEFIKNLDQLNIFHLSNGKTNIGLGLPRKEF